MAPSSLTSDNESTTASEGGLEPAPCKALVERDTDPTTFEEDELSRALTSSTKGLREVLQRLLETGGDERSVTNPQTGLSKYHTPSMPCEGIHRSCCTSNAPDRDAFERGLDTLRKLLLEAKNTSQQNGQAAAYSSPEELYGRLLRDIRERLRAVYGLSCEDIISLFPSGTDAELMPSLLALMRAASTPGRGSEIFSVVTAAGEVGSGTFQASLGQDFAKRLPSGNAPLGGVFFTAEGHKVPNSGKFTGASLCLRDAVGRLLPMADRDQLVEEAVEQAISELGEGGKPRFGSVIVHMVVGSKTGKIMPSSACLDRLVEKYGSLVVPVVDLCQGRMAEGSIRGHLDKGRIVLSTGSKFFGGPPFSGVCLMPNVLGQELDSLLQNNSELADMLRSSRLKEYVIASLMSDDLRTLSSLLPRKPLNYGVLVRWTLALHSMESYYAEVPLESRKQIMQQWTTGVTQMVRGSQSHLIHLIQDEPETAQDEQSLALSTIVSFHCFCNRGTPATAADTMTMEELRHVQFLMASDLSELRPQLQLIGSAKTRVFMGQPVDLSPQGAGQAVAGGVSVLRVAASAPLVVRAWREGLQAVLDEDKAAFAKLELILGNWFLFAKESSNL